MSEPARIRDAIILAEPDRDPLRPVARVPYLVRTILSLQRAGIERCVVVGAGSPPADRRIRCDVVTAPAMPPAVDDRLRIVVDPGTLVDATLVRDLQSRARPGRTLDVAELGGRVRVVPGALSANGGTPERPAHGTLRRVDMPGTVGALLQALENPRDGWLDRILHRRLSRPLTRLLLHTPLSPNAVTVLGIALGVAGGFVLGLPGPSAVAVAILLLVASAVLDCSDGELARICHAESRLGHWLDISGDTVVHLAVLWGIVERIARTGSPPGRGWVVLLLVGVIGAFVVITRSEATEARRRRVAAWENTALDRVLSPLTTRDWHVFPVAFALAGRLDLLVPAAAVGAQVFWMLGLLLLVRVLRRAPV